MFTFSFGENVFDVTFAIYINNQIAQQFRMTSSQSIIELKFIALVQEIASQNQPAKVVLSREEVIWDQFEQRHKILPVTVEFQNY